MLLSKRLRACVCACAVVLPIALEAAERPGPAEQEVLDADMQRVEAMLKGDVAALDRLLAPELTCITARARVEDKQSLLYAARSGQTAYETIVPTERVARVTGTTAIVTGVTAMKGVDRQEAFSIAARYTAVYVRRDGRWQLAAFQATELPPGAA